MGEVVEFSHDDERIAALERMLALALDCGRTCEDARRNRPSQAGRTRRDGCDQETGDLSRRCRTSRLATLSSSRGRPPFLMAATFLWPAAGLQMFFE
jgi:hypothetical protein